MKYKSPWLLSSLFFLSGLVALVYETLWIKILGIQFGHSAWALSTVVGSFMAGLGLGSWIAGRWAARCRYPIWVYGALEVGIAFFGFVSLPLLQNLGHVLHPVYNFPVIFLALRIILVFIVLLIPTLLMGASLPILVSLLSNDDSFKAWVGWFYGINTLGAACGVLLAGFYLLPHFGVQSTLYINVGIGFLVGVFAMRLGSQMTGAPIQTSSIESSSSDFPKLILAAAFVGGFLGIFFEICWSRLLTPILGSSTYTFSILLLVFLLGTAMGSLIAAQVKLSRTQSANATGICFLLIFCTALAGLPLVNFLPRLFVSLVGMAQGRIGLFFLMQAIIIGCLIILPTICLGFLLPTLINLFFGEEKKAGSALGTIYATNTMGAILGSLFSGFLFLPRVGVSKSILIAAGVALFSGMVLILEPLIWPRRMKRLCYGLLFMGAIFIYQCGPTIDAHYLQSGFFRKVLASQSTQSNPGDLVFYQDGISSTVTVYRTTDETLLKVNGKTDASTAGDLKTQILLAQLPLCLHPQPKTACVIGFGSGATVAAAATHSLDKIDVIELEPAVLNAATRFTSINKEVWKDPRVDIHVEDGRTFLQYTQKKFDVVISEPSNPWIAGVGTLFSKEFYELAAQRLNERGVFCQWIQTYELSSATLHVMIDTLQSVFPHVKIFISQGDIICVASRNPITTTFHDLQIRMKTQAIQDSLSLIQVENPYELLVGYYAALPDDAKDYFSSNKNTDDNSFLEYRAPLEMYSGVANPPPMPNTLHVFHYYVRDFFSDQNPQQVAVGLSQAIFKLRPYSLRRLKEMALMFKGTTTEPTLHKISSDCEIRNTELQKNDARFIEAAQFMGSGKYEQAENLFGIISRTDPYRPALSRLRAICFLHLRQLEQAKHCLEAAVKLNPDDYEALTQVGYIHFTHGDRHRAELLWRRVLTLNPAFQEARTLIEKLK